VNQKEGHSTAEVMLGTHRYDCVVLPDLDMLEYFSHRDSCFARLSNFSNGHRHASPHYAWQYSRETRSYCDRLWWRRWL